MQTMKLWEGGKRLAIVLSVAYWIAALTSAGWTYSHTDTWVEIDAVNDKCAPDFKPAYEVPDRIEITSSGLHLRTMACMGGWARTGDEFNGFPPLPSAIQHKADGDYSVEDPTKYLSYPRLERTPGGRLYMPTSDGKVRPVDSLGYVIPQRELVQKPEISRQVALRVLLNWTLVFVALTATVCAFVWVRLGFRHEAAETAHCTSYLVCPGASSPDGPL